MVALYGPTRWYLVGLDTRISEGQFCRYVKYPIIYEYAKEHRTWPKSSAMVKTYFDTHAGPTVSRMRDIWERSSPSISMEEVKGNGCHVRITFHWANGSTEDFTLHSDFLH